MVMVFGFRKYLKPLIDVEDRTEEFTAVGKTVTITDVGENGNKGRGKLNGSTWPVRNEGANALNVGDELTVEKIDGSTAVVNK